MTFVSFRKHGILSFLGGFLVIVLLAAPAPQTVQAQGQDDEPIAYVGHGAFFDHNGRQIVPTADWVSRAQDWYRRRLLAGLSADQQRAFATRDRQMIEGLPMDGQDRLFVQQRALDLLAARLPRTVANGRLRARLSALDYRLRWRLAPRDALDELRTLRPFRPDRRIEERLRLPQFRASRSPLALATTGSGQSYIDECAAAQVPVPPPIGLLDPSGAAGWRSMGFIPQTQQFIVGSPAEVRVFENANGMCIALPRYTDESRTVVGLDGVICLSKITSRVCVWDNQWDDDADPTTTPVTFDFPAGSRIPIGIPDLTMNPAGQYQAGGAEIEFGPGGICTDCHAGENPYIIHPNADLGGGYSMGDLATDFPTFGPNRYTPIVGASWPQNQLSHTQAQVPPVCSGCHTDGGSGGRFPQLSSGLSNYCGTVLRNGVAGTPASGANRAIPATMPPRRPGSAAGTQPVIDFLAWCGVPANAGPSNGSDPHLITNGLDHNFQTGSGFTSHRDSWAVFELRTRQTRFLASFAPDANPTPEQAPEPCWPSQDRTAFQNCLFDPWTEGRDGGAEAYLRIFRLRSSPPPLHFIPTVRLRSSR